jgi:hypothetical protein
MKWNGWLEMVRGAAVTYGGTDWVLCSAHLAHALVKQIILATRLALPLR